MGRTMEKALKFLKDCGVFYLATVEGDQAGAAPSPCIRPFGAVCGFQDKLYIIIKARRFKSSI